MFMTSKFIVKHYRENVSFYAKETALTYSANVFATFIDISPCPLNLLPYKLYNNEHPPFVLFSMMVGCSHMLHVFAPVKYGHNDFGAYDQDETDGWYTNGIDTGKTLFLKDIINNKFSIMYNYHENIFYSLLAELYKGNQIRSFDLGHNTNTIYQNLMYSHIKHCNIGLLDMGTLDVLPSIKYSFNKPRNNEVVDLIEDPDPYPVPF
jgi:hypothetical protein